MTDGESPQNQACPKCGLEHPPAGKGCVVPPVEHRFPPGVSANPGGRPKGSFSARAYGRSKWARNPDEETGVGERARAAWDELEEAARAGNVDLVKTLTAVIAEIEGKPTEYVERTNVKRFEVNMQPRRGATEPPK